MSNFILVPVYNVVKMQNNHTNQSKIVNQRIK